MLIRTISQDNAIAALQNWNGQRPNGKSTEAERMFRALCDRYVYVEVEDIHELSRMNSLEEYITGGHSFYVYMRYPEDVAMYIHGGRVDIPRFIFKCEDHYSSGSGRGGKTIFLFGLLAEAMDKRYDYDVFFDQVQTNRDQAVAYDSGRAEPYYTQPPVYAAQEDSYYGQGGQDTYYGDDYAGDYGETYDSGYDYTYQDQGYYPEDQGSVDVYEYGA